MLFRSGRAGMASIVAEEALDLTAFRRHLNDRLPSYARPLFLRIMRHMDVTATFKQTKSELIKAAYDPALVNDPVYFDDAGRQAFVHLDHDLFEEIQSGTIRL